MIKSELEREILQHTSNGKLDNFKMSKRGGPVRRNSNSILYLELKDHDDGRDISLTLSIGHTKFPLEQEMP